MSPIAEELTTQIEALSGRLQRLRDEVGKVIVGQSYMVDRLLMGLLADGHVLLEGVPGLAKTLPSRPSPQAIDTRFSRIQFTPDLLPADLIGTEIYRPQQTDFVVKKGPIFANLMLADEINRAPAKVQSALLEAMQERQVTIGDTTYPLPDPFLVLATQNPIEQEGTYPLPEAQVDRFMLKLRVGYPDKPQEKEIMRRMAQRHRPNVEPVVTPAEIREMRDLADSIYLDQKVEDYIVDLVFATREPAVHKLERLENLIEYGASPRASIYLAQVGQGAGLPGRPRLRHAAGRQDVGPDVLRHRILLTYEAEAEDLTSDDVIAEIFDTVDVP